VTSDGSLKSTYIWYCVFWWFGLVLEEERLNVPTDEPV